MDHTQASAPSVLIRSSLVAKRLAVFVLTIATIYVLVESEYDGIWYFGLIWKGKVFDSKYWRDAIFYLLDDQTKYVAIFILGTFCFALLLHAKRKTFLPFVDGHWFWICVGAIAVCSSVTVLSYHNNVQTYELMDNYASQVESTLELLRKSNPQLLVPNPPVDFDYVDDDAVGKMYSQLGPSLVEEKRTIESTQGEGAKAEIGVEATKIEGHVEQSHKTESIEERVKFSTDRKCLTLMNYAQDRHILHAYSERVDWMNNHMVNDFMVELTEDVRLMRPGTPITERTFEKLG